MKPTERASDLNLHAGDSMYNRTCRMNLNAVVRLLLVSTLILGQSFNAFAAQGATTAPQTAAKLNIVIVEGEGAINNIQQRVAREVIVQVNDENNRPVGGA